MTSQASAVPLSLPLTAQAGCREAHTQVHLNAVGSGNCQDLNLALGLPGCDLAPGGLNVFISEIRIKWSVTLFEGQTVEVPSLQ